MSAGEGPIALTMGEPAGVGAEISARAWAALRDTGPVFFIIDDPVRFDSLTAPVRTISRASEAAGAFREALPVIPVGKSVTAEPGAPHPDNAAAVIASIEIAVALALSGDALAVTTNPIQKSILHAAGFSFPGHTEFLGDLTKDVPMPGGLTRGPVMMLAAPGLRTIPVTVHHAVRDAAELLSVDAILHCGRVVADALRQDFGIEAPRLAVSGLNPHAGEDGRMGHEDRDVIAPAVAALRATGVNARGPLPADTMFHARARAGYDAALCMLHDQALIPVKTLAFDEAVNITLGLPIVRTSPDHGTALDIAGKGLARADSLIAALRLADELGRRRHD